MDLRNGDCLEVLKTLPDNSIDSLVTDPPYFLTDKNGTGFMGKKWDSLDADTETVGKSAEIFHKKWADEAFRVLKPGAYGLVFGGTRTFHRMTCALEDSGFEIKDVITWLYAQGFPKSRDLWKNDFQKEVEKQLRELGVVGKIVWK